jgi:uncharacterized membrane protein
MAHCTKCGAAIADNAGFCGSCGSAQGAGAPVVSNSTPATGQTGLEQNVAGALCYALGWVTGLIFFLIDKRPTVRFHAAQSIVVFGGIAIIYIVLGPLLGASFFAGGLGLWSIFHLVYTVLGLVTLVLWILLMVKAYQGEQFRVPIAADVADKIFGKA